MSRTPHAFWLVAAVVLTGGPSAAPLLAQSQTATESTSWRTPWGDPDIQGLWNNFTITPLERPEALGEQEFFSAEEAAAFEQRAIEGVNRDNARSEVRTDPLPVGGDVGAYNSFWTDQGTRVVPTGRTSIIFDPSNGRLPPLTPEGLNRITSPANRRLADIRDGRVPADGPEQMGLSERCLWYRGIPTFPTGYNNHHHILQTPDWVVILQEHIHDVRYIALDGRPPLPPAVRQFAGDSRGHWEGDTLVVETSGFRSPFIRRWARPEHSLARGALTEALRVVERFRRVDADTLDYEFTVEDPGTFSRPWSGSLPWARSEGPMYEFACHEGNYGLMNMMAGSRAEEAAARSAR